MPARRCAVDVMLRLLVGFLAIATPALSKPPTPLVRRIGPLNLAENVGDATLRRAFGEGCYSEDGGHLGSRYFTNSKRTRTLHVEFGVDWVIELIELSDGVRIPAACSMAPALVSKRLDRSLSIEHGLRLGMSPENLLLLLGVPARDTSADGTRLLVYEASYETDPRVDLFYEARYSFQAGKLVSVSLYHGD